MSRKKFIESRTIYVEEKKNIEKIEREKSKILKNIYINKHKCDLCIDIRSDIGDQRPNEVFSSEYVIERLNEHNLFIFIVAFSISLFLFRFSFKFFLNQYLCSSESSTTNANRNLNKIYTTKMHSNVSHRSNSSFYFPTISALHKCNCISHHTIPIPITSWMTVFELYTYKTYIKNDVI